MLAFDAARREVARRRRPWHRALIAERAARVHLAHGLEQSGLTLLAEAPSEYLARGASAKVDRLDWAYCQRRRRNGRPVHRRHHRPARDPLRVPGAEPGYERRAAAQPRRRRAPPDDRRHRHVPGAVERGAPRLAPRRGGPDAGAALHAAGGRAVGRRGRDPGRPLRPGSLLHGRRPRLAADRARLAAARCGRCWCSRTASSAARSRRTGSTS
jgi:hypothetical protein